MAKKYTNPSSDIIEVLAGLDNVDAVFTELVTALDQVIKDGRTRMFKPASATGSCTDSVLAELRQKAVRTTIAVVSGAYQTVLVSYFINRDFFPSLMKVISDTRNIIHGRMY